jgi:hypothetical protein
MASTAERMTTMWTAVARGALAGLVLLSMACGGSTAPTASRQRPAVASSPAPAPANFPALSGPSRTFTFDHNLTTHPRDYTQMSRFVLYDNGAFALQYVSLGGEYHGGYTESNGVITFEWEGWSIAGPWGATGTLNDGSLSVRYNEIMQLSDFEDAVYALRK